LKYSQKRDAQYLTQLIPLLEELELLEPDNYHGRLMRAIILYKEGAVDDAINKLSASTEKDPTWRYSIGFLYAFKGEIDAALEQYRKAAYKVAATGVINDIEIFVTEEIERNPQLTQLIFFRGLINYKSKPDYKLAREDFVAFLGSDGIKKYPRLKVLAEKFLGEIDVYVGREI
jgi:tetratricopeptide (TPR) repeat protein